MKRRKNHPILPEEQQDYDYEALREDRKYGLYWFSGLWRILRPVLIGLCALLIVFGVLSTVWSHVQDKYLSPVDPADDTEIAFSVETGNSLSRVSRNLESAGLIKNSSVFKYYCDFAGMGQKIQAGDYKVKKSMDMFQIAELLTTGDGRPTVTDITIIPGYTIENIANYLKEKGILQDTAEFLSLCKTGEGVTDYYFIQDELKTQNVNSRKYLLEGYLAPNTYEVYLNATPKDIVKKLLDQTDYVFSTEWQDRASELGMTMDQALTLASMIEKEAANDDERAMIAAVIYNRIAAGMPLQIDSTIMYVLPEHKDVLTVEDTKIDSPYNTYQNTGLPPTPIANPGLASIKATLSPASTKALYYALDSESGTHKFFTSYGEFQAFVAKQSYSQ